VHDRTCSTCGHVNPDEARWCGRCGDVLAAPAADTAADTAVGTSDGSAPDEDPDGDPGEESDGAPAVGGHLRRHAVLAAAGTLALVAALVAVVTRPPAADPSLSSATRSSGARTSTTAPAVDAVLWRRPVPVTSSIGGEPVPAEPAVEDVVVEAGLVVSITPTPTVLRAAPEGFERARAFPWDAGVLLAQGGRMVSLPRDADPVALDTSAADTAGGNDELEVLTVTPAGTAVVWTLPREGDRSRLLTADLRAPAPAVGVLATTDGWWSPEVVDGHVLLPPGSKGVQVVVDVETSTPVREVPAGDLVIESSQLLHVDGDWVVTLRALEGTTVVDAFPRPDGSGGSVTTVPLAEGPFDRGRVAVADAGTGGLVVARVDNAGTLEAFDLAGRLRWSVRGVGIDARLAVADDRGGAVLVQRDPTAPVGVLHDPLTGQAGEEVALTDPRPPLPLRTVDVTRGSVRVRAFDPGGGLDLVAGTLRGGDSAGGALGGRPVPAGLLRASTLHDGTPSLSLVRDTGDDAGETVWEVAVPGLLDLGDVVAVDDATALVVTVRDRSGGATLDDPRLAFTPGVERLDLPTGALEPLDLGPDLTVFRLLHDGVGGVLGVGGTPDGAVTVRLDPAAADPLVWSSPGAYQDVVVTGQVVWRVGVVTAVPLDLATGEPGEPVLLPGRVRAASGTDDTLLVVLADGGVAALGADGRLRWASSALPAPVTSVPVVAGDRVVVGDATGRVRLLDLGDGRLRGTVDTTTGRPVRALTVAERILVAWAGDDLVAIGPAP
jgi:hypothetical protein